MDAAVGADGDAVVGIGQILRQDKEGDHPAGDGVGEKVRHQRRRQPVRDLSLDRRAAHIFEHLDLAHGIGEAVLAVIEIVDGERLGEVGAEVRQRQGDDRRRGMEHVVPADHARAVGEPRGVSGIGRAQPQRRRIGGAGRRHDDVAFDPFLAGDAIDHDGGRALARSVGLDADGAAPGHQRDVVVGECLGKDGGARIHLGQHLARKAAAGPAADAGCGGGIGVVAPYAERQRRGMPAEPAEMLGKRRDARIVGKRRKGEGRVVGLVARVDMTSPMHFPQSLGLGVPRRHVDIAHRPRRRRSAMILHAIEIALLHAHQRGAVEGRVAARPVMGVRVEGAAVLVDPGVARLILAVDEDCLGRPVVRLDRQHLTALEDEDRLARIGQRMGERSAAGAGADDDHVIGSRHRLVLPTPRACRPSG